MAATVTLENTGRTALVLNLNYLEAGDVTLCKRQVVGRLVVDPKTGHKSVAVHKRKLSESLTLRPKGKLGSKVVGLPLSVLKCSDVVEHGKPGGRLLVRVLDEDQAAEQAAKLEAAALDAERHQQGRELRAEKLLARGGKVQ